MKRLFTVKSRHQVTLTKEYCHAFGLDKKDILMFIPTGTESYRIRKKDQNCNEYINKEGISQATITEKYQITIPKILQNKIKIGDSFIIEENGFLLINPCTCFACHGTGQLEGKKCFICFGHGSFPKSVKKDPIQHLAILLQQMRKYKVSLSIKNHDIIDGKYEMLLIPNIKFNSSEYSRPLLDKIQDEFTMRLIEQFVPRSVQDKDKYMCPSDSILNTILNNLVCEESREIVKKWFRYDKTPFEITDNRGITNIVGDTP